MGIPGLNLRFSRPVWVSMMVGAIHDGYWMQIQSLSETGVAWTNTGQARVIGGRCTFPVNHATYFAGGLILTRPTGSIRINAGASRTRTHRVTLYLSSRNPPYQVTGMRFSNNGRNWTSWKPYRTRWTWYLTDSRYGGTRRKGTKYVHVRFRNSKGIQSPTYKDTIRYW